MAAENMSTSKCAGTALRGTTPHSSRHKPKASTAREVTYNASSMRRDFFSTKVASPAAGQPQHVSRAADVWCDYRSVQLWQACLSSGAERSAEIMQDASVPGQVVAQQPWIWAWRAQRQRLGIMIKFSHCEACPDSTYGMRSYVLTS